MICTIRDLMPNDLEFQIFVLDELADDLAEQGDDVLELTIGVPELPMMTEIVLDRVVEKIHDPDFVRRVYPKRLPELRQAIAEFYSRLHDANVSADSPSLEIHHAVTAAKGGNA